MRTMIIALLSCAFVTACTTPSIEGKTPLTSAELKSTFIGKTVVSDAPGAKWTKTYHPDGRVNVVSRRGKLDGTYKIENDMICSSYKTGEGKCRKYYKDGNSFIRVTDAGDVDGEIMVRN